MARMSRDEQRFRAESDLRTLQDADRIKQDQKRMSAAKKVATEQMKALQKVTTSPASGTRRGGKR